MLTLFTILWFMSFILLLTGLLKPTLLKGLKIPLERKSVLMYIGIPCFLLLIGVGAFAPKRVKMKVTNENVEKLRDQPAKKEELSKENIKAPIIRDNKQAEPVVIEKSLPGITPVDVYGNFEKIGFKTEKKISSNGSFFYSDYSENGIENHVTTYCENGVANITSVRLSATRIEPQYNKVTDMKEFLKYGCSIPYDGADIEKVKDFIDHNYYKNKATVIISGVRFTIYVPTEFARMIDIEKE